ncbi:MAG TPA: hypothetical protein VFA77_13260 [Candidatus Eisenbacteria bacterium]|jgi:DNA-directed RNA polymerase specialized sigma24 family protein|nr:hypothetical protein [Candidatus Eisenbacteria bacterium]
MRNTDLSRIEKLMELHYPTLFRFAERLCGSPAEAMVLTQRTFRLAFDFSLALPVPVNNRAWLFAILFDKFLEGHRAYTGELAFARAR